MSWLKRMLTSRVETTEAAEQSRLHTRHSSAGGEPDSSEETRTEAEYVEHLSAVYTSWTSKKDILADVQMINDLGASLKKRRGDQFCREIVEALSIRSSEQAQALANAWRVEWVDRSAKPTEPEFKVGDKVRVRGGATIDLGYGVITRSNFENGSWFHWVRRADKPASWEPAKTAEHSLTRV